MFGLKELDQDLAVTKIKRSPARVNSFIPNIIILEGSKESIGQKWVNKMLSYPQKCLFGNFTFFKTFSKLVSAAIEFFSGKRKENRNIRVGLTNFG